MKIKRIKIFSNDNDFSNKTKKKLLNKLKAHDFEIDNDNPDLVIAIGGDGSFIRMIKDSKYDTEKYYVGINCGTLGFLQNIHPNELDEFISRLKKDDYILEEISVQETEITTTEDTQVFYAINEILIREKNLDTVNLEVKIDDEFLENYYGDGLLISTSTGSTAYNLSFGGSIVYNSFHTMQITPVAPLNNNAYRNIINSLILPENMIIKLNPLNNKNNLLFSVDGEHFVFDKIEEVRINCKNRKIKCLRLNDYHFVKTINEKFLK